MQENVMKAQAESSGLDWDNIKRGIERLLPVLETIARLTPNPYDDAAVMFLRTVIQSNNTPVV